MDLLQYSFTLAPGHAMEAIRERVAAKRELVRTLPGLRWKAWLISQPLRGRPQPKRYAPLYLFEDTPSVHAFLGGPIYQGVTDAFGWTHPHHGHAITPRDMQVGRACSCTLGVTGLGHHEALRSALERGPGESTLPARFATPGSFLGTVNLLDIARMEWRSYAFWTCEAQALAEFPADLVYEVVDVSLPLHGA